MASKDAQTKGRLGARPVQVTGAAPLGLLPLMLGSARDSYLYVPATYQAERPAPLVLLLHGAGGHARQGLELLRSLADAAGLLLLAPASREHTCSRYAVAPERVAIGGFSDGASYALSLGITNGDLFTHVIAFSPGFMAPAGQTGTPRIFVSHGTRDGVLPIERCSRRIVPELERGGYDVLYREFDGGHTISGEIALEAVGWFTRRSLS